MSIPVFVLVFLSSLGGYLLVSMWQERRQRASVLARFSGKDLILSAVRDRGRKVYAF